MLVKIVTRCLMAVAVLAPAARATAAGWETPEWTARVQAVSTSDLFPGYANTRSDRALETTLEVESATRMGGIKTALSLHGGGIRYAHFSEASYGWAGARVQMRRGATRWHLETEWTPGRVKFPSEPDNAEFKRWRWDAGVRHRAGDVGFGLGGRLDRDDYVAAFDGRDATSPSVDGFVGWKPGGGRLELRLFGEWRGRDTDSPDYVFREREAGGGARWSANPWRLGGEIRSGVRRYTEAPPSDSNHRRRDQWIELRGSVERELGLGLSGRAQVEFRDRTSSRLDRFYQVTTVRVGVAWTGGGE